METFLQQVHRVAIAKAELRRHNFIAQLQQPELQPSPPQKCARHAGVKIAALHAGERSRLSPAGPAHLVQGEKGLQMGVQVLLALAALNVHAVARLQTPGISREQRTKAGFKTFKIFLPGCRQRNIEVRGSFGVKLPSALPRLPGNGTRRQGSRRQGFQRANVPPAIFRQPCDECLGAKLFISRSSDEVESVGVARSRAGHAKHSERHSKPTLLFYIEQGKSQRRFRRVHEDQSQQLFAGAECLPPRFEPFRGLKDGSSRRSLKQGIPAGVKLLKLRPCAAHPYAPYFLLDGRSGQTPEFTLNGRHGNSCSVGATLWPGSGGELMRIKLLKRRVLIHHYPNRAKALLCKGLQV